MDTKILSRRLTQVAAVSLSISLLITGLAHADDNDAPTEQTPSSQADSPTVAHPLYQARDSLKQAVADTKNDSLADARQNLDKALDYLEQAKQSTDKTVSEAAVGLLAEGKTLRDDLEKPPSYNLTDELEKLGQHLEAWAERAINYSNARWSDMTSYSPLKIDLIEARFHLQNAIIDQTTGHERQGADSQLGEVQKALDKSMTEADEYWTDPLYKQQISDMQTRIGRLLKSPAEIPGAISEGQLGNIQQELQMIINSL